MLYSFHRVFIVFVCFFSFATAHAQETRVVVVPLGGDDIIDQCEAITACAGGQKTLRCPSGNEQITCAIPKRVFVTSSTHTGDLDGLDGADAICQDLANAAGMYGEFKAWLSDLNMNPSTRFIKNEGPYLRLDGKVVAESFRHLTLSLLNPISVDETGTPLNGSYVWTNTDSSGSVIENDPQAACGHFQSADAENRGPVGFSYSTGTSWSSTSAVGVCTERYRLYCFEQ